MPAKSLVQCHICRDHRVHRCLGLDESEFTKLVIVFIFLLHYAIIIASMNNVVVTVVYLYWNVY